MFLVLGPLPTSKASKEKPSEHSKTFWCLSTWRIKVASPASGSFLLPWNPSLLNSLLTFSSGRSSVAQTFWSCLQKCSWWNSLSVTYEKPRRLPSAQSDPVHLGQYCLLRLAAVLPGPPSPIRVVFHFSCHLRTFSWRCRELNLRVMIFCPPSIHCTAELWTFLPTAFPIIWHETSFQATHLCWDVCRIPSDSDKEENQS